MAEYELYHHGVKGMKWGVRRYQNPDGSLTAAGKKRYDSMSDDKLQKTLYKQVKKARADQYGSSNRWGVSNTIGEHSKAAQDKYRKALKDHMDSEAYKQAEKKRNELDKKYDSGKIDLDKYNSEYEKVSKSVYRPDLDASVRYTSAGRSYSKAYINTYGKELNVGYLKDLGYNDKVAKKLTERVLKSNRKMLDGM